MPHHRLTSALDLEQAQVKRLVPPYAPLETTPLVAAPVGISSSIGSIQPSTAVKNSFSQPKISPPRGSDFESYREFNAQFHHPLVSLIALFIKNDELTAIAIEIFANEAQYFTDKKERLQAELMKAIEEQLKAEKDEKKWGVFQSVFQYFVSAASIVIGAALVATGVGAVAGSLLIASGGLGLLNQAMTETGGWKELVAYFDDSKTFQEETSQKIQLGIFFVSMALSLAGGAMAINSGTLTDIVNLDRAVKILTVSSTVCGTGTQLAKASIRQRWSVLEAKIVETRGEIDEAKQDFSSASREMQQLESYRKEAAEALKSSIENLTQES